MPRYQRRVDGVPYTISPITTLLSKNSINITRDGDGKISQIVITDGVKSKTMDFTRDGNGKLTNIATT